MKPTNDIAEFCKQHGACAEGREWALANCKDMAEAWDKAKPEWLVWIATRPGVLDDKTLRLFACWCVRQVWPLLTDARSRNAVEVAERYADGKSTDEELAAAMAAAMAAASAAASAAAWAARDTAWAACDTAWAARAAALAACDTAWAARAAALAAQTAHLRSLGNPFKINKETR